MQVYRLAKCVYIHDMEGTGARLYGGRWNSKGLPVLYTAGSRSLALLEAMAHLPQKNMTADYCMALIQIPDHVSVENMNGERLPPKWRSVAIQSSLQNLGDQWLKKGKTPVLRVPSVIIPEEYNYLINPLHPDARKIRIRQQTPFVFDERLKEEA